MSENTFLRYPSVKATFRADVGSQLFNLFDQLERDGAYLPYWPEMLDFDLEENKAYERAEIEAYLNTFPVRDAP